MARQTPETSKEAAHKQGSWADKAKGGEGKEWMAGMGMGMGGRDLQVMGHGGGKEEQRQRGDVSSL
jgi:hypothetical protein